MRIPFVGPAYQSRSLNADCQRAVNCFLEFDNASPRAPIALYGTPGTVLEFTLGATPVRGSITQGQFSFFVAGNRVYKVDTSYAATLLGTIGTSTGPVGLASNGAEVLVVDGTGGWLATTGALTQITDVDFPNGVRSCCFIGGFFVVTGDGSGQFYWNETPNQGTEWNGLDFASAEGSPDATVGCVASHLELILFGNSSSEIWVLTGAADLPFIRSGNTFIEVGAAAYTSINTLDNTVFWLGQDTEGAGIVYRLNGYTPVRISTHAIEKEIQSYATITDAIGFTYQQEGHSFYVLTFPTASRTWVFDVATSQWHERAWMNQSTGELYRWRANCHIYFNNKNLVGDFENGKVYSLDLDTYTDDGEEIKFLRTTQCLDSPEGQRNFYDFLTVDMETGVGLATGLGSSPLLMLEWSNDGGHTWCTNPQYLSIGAVGEYGARARATRLGQGRNRVWRISITDPVKRAVLGAYTRFRVGAS